MTDGAGTRRDRVAECERQLGRSADEIEAFIAEMREAPEDNGVDEFRLLYAARKLRPRPVMPDGRMRRRRWAIELVDLLTAGVTVALRRADEMGDAITARGGTGQISAAPSRPKKADWVALGIVAVVGVAAFFVEIPGLA